MATVYELADTARDLRNELVRRIDELEEAGSMDQHGAACIGGIVEWLASLEDAMRKCNGKPSPKTRREEIGG